MYKHCLLVLVYVYCSRPEQACTSVHPCRVQLYIMMHVRVLYYCKSFNYATFVLYVWASIALLYVELCFREYRSSSFSPGNKVPHTSTKV